ncbi:hypothetical protein OKW50_007420 [Paraburkholderia youngii]|uniref:Uncharacterized protein n=1 Tax=Paraburkholderia youngii TaxID=2782701 RepID=A0A7W8LDN7_9BURK|nr:hypothetical protein [Paraburkholderia youngii]MBB5405112.1 hypothetical protein [Paraburkholderia youngii]
MTERIEDVLAEMINVSTEIRVRTSALAKMEGSLARSDEPLLRDALDTTRRELSLLHQLKGELIGRLLTLENGARDRAATNRPMPIP